jgi:hypothetical protein
MSWDSSVDKVTDYGLDDPVLIPDSARFFSSSQRPDWLWSNPALYPMSTGGKVTGV